MSRAPEPAHIQLGSSVKAISLEDIEDKTEAWLVVGSVRNQLELEFGEYGSLAGATVRVRFDDERAQTRVLPRATSNTAVLFPDSIATIRTMMRHDRLR